MHEAELTTFYIDQMLALLATPLGVLGLLGLLVLAAAAVTVPAMRWVSLTALLYIATVPLTSAGVQYTPLAFPLEQFRAFGRPLIYLFMVLMLPPLFMSERGWRRRLVAAPLVLFVVFEILIALRLMAFGNFVRGMLSIVSHALVLLTLGVAAGRWMQSMQDVMKMVRCLSLAGCGVVVATVYQLTVNRSAIVGGSRLTGVTGNPQFLGEFIAFTLPFTCYLLTQARDRRWLKPLLAILIGITIVMLMWTGSRNGVLSTGLGLLVMFHRRLGRLAIGSAVVAVVVYFTLPFFEGSSDIAGRLIWTANTRAGAWAGMFDQFRQSPLFGVSNDTYNTAESSYLAMLSQFGIVGSVPCLVAIGLLMSQLLRLNRLRSRLGPDSGLVDLVCGAWVAVAVTSVFEGILMGVITFQVMFIYALSTLTTCLLDWAETDETYAFGDAPADFAAAA